MFQHRSSSAPLAEPLESRLLLAGLSQSLGTLNGRFFKQHTVLGSDTDAYTFHAALNAHIDIQLSRLIGTGAMSLKNSSGITVGSTSNSTSDQRIQFDDIISADDFTLSVRADQSQFAPAVAYTLAITTDLAPGARSSGQFATATPTGGARNVGTLSHVNETFKSDFVGYFDTSDHTASDLVDIYAFNFPTAGFFTGLLSRITQDVANGTAKVDTNIGVYKDTNNDGLLALSELIASTSVPVESTGTAIGISPDTVFDAGRYFVVVTPAQSGSVTIGGTNYTLTLRFVPQDLAGSTLPNARSVTLTSNPKNFVDYLDRIDPTDVYKFTFPQQAASFGGPFNFSASMSGVSGGASFEMDLVQDKNHNGTIDSGDTLVTATNTGTIHRKLSDPDTYFLVAKFISGESPYTLTMSAPTSDTVGNTLVAAKGLGTLSTSTVSEFVGAIDTADVYRFTTTQPGEIRIKITSGSVTADVIRDADNSGGLGSNEILTTLSSGTVLEGVVLPLAGNNYYVRIRPSGADSNYSATFAFSKQTPFSGSPIHITATGVTKIEAENFDAGPDPDAFHDTDATNSGGQFRTNVGVDIATTGDTGGGFRVTDTHTGEFLEYTVIVDQAGTYDFNFRLAGKGSGGLFHAEIDGANITGSQQVNDTHNLDSMTDHVVGGIPLSKGPHVLRLAFDAESNNGAGAYNFIAISPTGSAGTFKLSPAHASVKAGQSEKLALEWTVPIGGWRVLKDVELRLRDESGRTILRIRFNEATNTFQLYDPKKERFGKAKAVGSNSTLSNKFGRVNLSTSTVQADGPNDPSVLITFDVSFKKKLKGRHLTVEAAASDDLGHSSPFAPAGTIDVVK